MRNRYQVVGGRSTPTLRESCSQAVDSDLTGSPGSGALHGVGFRKHTSGPSNQCQPGGGSGDTGKSGNAVARPAGDCWCSENVATCAAQYTRNPDDNLPWNGGVNPSIY